MKRPLFTLAAAVSLLLGVFVAVIWVGGFSWVIGSVWKQHTPTSTTRYSMTIGPGSIAMERLTPPTDPPPQETEWFLGFGMWRGSAYSVASAGPNPLIADAYAVFVPFWFILLALVALPSWRATAFIKARLATPAGHCPTCGYDLRATPAKSGPLFDRCPECGTSAEMRNAEC